MRRNDRSHSPKYAQSSSDKNSSASIGVGFMVGAQTGMGITVAASAGKGAGAGEETTHNNTRIEAGQQVNISSGALRQAQDGSGDLNMRGAVVEANSVKAEVGGNLNIESLQDTSRYQESSKSTGGSITFGPAPSASVSLSKTKIDSNYASVAEQSGIKAGDGGFQVNVQGNTELKGGAISGSEAAVQEGKNRLSTATLQTSDLENSASANVSSSGIGLSSDMLTQGKYGVAKGVLGNLLTNADESGASSGATRAVVSGAQVDITDAAAQEALTGQSAEQTVASLNRDASGAHSAAQQQDVQKMKEDVQAQVVIRQAVVAEAVKFTDDSYRKIFVESHDMYELVRDESGQIKHDETTGRPLQRKLSEEEKTQLKPGPDGKIHIALNGIFNDQDAAATYAAQHSTTEGPQYFIHFPQANSVVSELLIAGYQKYLENDFWGLSNSTEQVKDAMQQYGQSGLHIDGHSRGSLTAGSALESQMGAPNAQGSLSGTTVNFFGPAYNAQDADGLLGTLQDRQNMPAAQQPGTVLQYQNHQADPVGRLNGGNAPTGGTLPEGSSMLGEALRAATGQPVTSHNCYGRSRDPSCAEFWRDTSGFPISSPAARPAMAPLDQGDKK